MRFPIPRLSLAVALLVATSVAAHAQPATEAPIKVKKAKPDSMVAVPVKRLFERAEPLEMTIDTDLKAFTRTRTRGAATRTSNLTYTDSAGQVVSLPIQLGTRGNFRLQARNCSFPPTRLVFDSVKKTEFAGQKRLKLVTRCQNNEEFDQYILQEYNLYRIYNLLTPFSFNVRLAKTTFTDRDKKEQPLTMWTFIIEDDGDMAKRNAAAILDQKGAVWEDLETESTRLVALFEYFIGNTDWSAGGLHNIRLVRDNSMVLRPVAYDMDWSGAIATRYARPDARLPIRSVRERLYRGPCMSEDDLASLTQLFVEKKDAIYALYSDLPGLKPDVAKRTLEYFDEFYKTVGDKRRAKREIIDACLPKGN